MPIIRIRKLDNQPLCKQCVDRSYINIEKQRLQAEVTLSDLCSQYEKYCIMLSNVKTKLACGNLTNLASKTTEQLNLRDKINKLLVSQNEEMHKIIKSFGQLKANDPRLFELNRQLDDSKRQFKEHLKKEMLQQVQRYFNRNVFEN